MKAIKLTESNTEKINAALVAMNGRAADHTYNDYRSIAIDASAQISKVEKLLGGAKHAKGVHLILESGDSVQSAYKYTRIGTRVVIECLSSGWFITTICRADIYQKGGVHQILFTPAHHDIAVAVLRKQYLVSQ